MTRPKTTTAVVQVLARAFYDEISIVKHKIPWDGDGMLWLHATFGMLARAQGLTEITYCAWDLRSRVEEVLARASVETLDGIVELRYDNKARAINVVAVMGQQQDVQASCEVCYVRASDPETLAEIEYAVQDLPKTTQNEET